MFADIGDFAIAYIVYHRVLIFVVRYSDLRWVKDFGVSDKSQVVYELATCLDSLGLKLSVSVKQ